MNTLNTLSGGAGHKEQGGGYRAPTLLRRMILYEGDGLPGLRTL